MILIYPGVHPPSLTEQFLGSLGWSAPGFSVQPPTHPPADQPIVNCAVFPADSHAPYSGFHCRQFMEDVICDRRSPNTYQDSSVSIIAFSAGVVGAISAAQYWHQRGVSIAHFIAIDGWGVPLVADFPLHRISHDHFTHWSSALLGTGSVNFYADPAIDHLDLWQAPDQAMGWRVEQGKKCDSRMSAAQFIRHVLFNGKS